MKYIRIKTKPIKIRKPTTDKAIDVCLGTIPSNKPAKIFISQPMRDKTNEEIEAVRSKSIAKAAEILGESVEIEIIDSFFKDAPHDAAPLWFLGKSLELMSKADIVCFAKGWENARGCKIEHECALQYGKTVVEV